MSTSARPLLAIVSGAPGAGKTTLARTISSRLALPFLARDELKETIGDELGTPSDVPESQLLGLVAYRILFAVTARILESGNGAVIESNFRRGVSEPDLRPLVEMADARLVHCSAAAPTVQARYAQRFQLGDRHPVHLDGHRAGGLADDLAAGLFEPLALQIPTLVVATGDGYSPAIEHVLEFLAARDPATRPRAMVASR